MSATLAPGRYRDLAVRAVVACFVFHRAGNFELQWAGQTIDLDLWRGIFAQGFEEVGFAALTCDGKVELRAAHSEVPEDVLLAARSEFLMALSLVHAQAASA